MHDALLPIIVFAIVYAAITFELLNKAVASMLGVMVLLTLHVVTEHTAIEFIDFETIMLLLGMMTIVAILRKSGFFNIISVRIAELTKGSPLKILVLFSVLTAVLSAFLDMEKNINVIVLQQDLAKTKRMIGQLRQSDVPLQAVPEHSLSHYIGQADKMFCAALSVTADRKVVAPVGTANITSLCHFHKIPVYLFANTLKFAHGVADDQRIHRETVRQDKDAQAYELVTYSHDVVDLNMVDCLVTEDGIYAKDQIPDYLKQLYT